MPRQFTPKATFTSDKVLFMGVSSHYIQIIKMQMYLQRISVKLHCNLLTFGTLRIIELLQCHLFVNFI